MTVRRLMPDDAALWRPLRLEALQTEPHAFGSRHADWVDRPLADFAETLKAIRYQGALPSGQLVGCMGWLPQGPGSEAHRGLVVGVYLQAAHRGAGLAAAMLDALIADATGRVDQLELAVGAENPRALQFYLNHGFTRIGHIPRALRHGATDIDEILLWRPLDA